MATLIKVGGSLYSLPNLGELLRCFLSQVQDTTVILFPGGGPAVDVIRRLDKLHALGDEAAHELALRMLTVNAYFLACLLPGVPVVPRLLEGGQAILDPHALADSEKERADTLPCSWEVTSDALAVRAAALLGAGELVLLKSVPLPDGIDWEQTARQGLVDAYFAKAHAAAKNVTVRWVNLRTWQP